MNLAWNLAETLHRDGFALVPDAISGETRTRLSEAIGRMEARPPNAPGARDLLGQSPEVRDFARSPEVRELIALVLGERAFAARGLLFDKTPAVNWRVPWHQDLTIAVRERRDAPGFGPWSVKAGIVHVQPPAALLERMLTVRLHLDDCTLDNGPLRVLPGSHRCGRLDAAAIARWRESAPPVPCPVPAGGILLMRPLLLHASSPATRPGHRRVIHLEFAAEPLPGGLDWHEAVGP